MFKRYIEQLTNVYAQIDNQFEDFTIVTFTALDNGENLCDFIFLDLAVLYELRLTLNVYDYTQNESESGSFFPLPQVCLKKKVCPSCNNTFCICSVYSLLESDRQLTITKGYAKKICMTDDRVVSSLLRQCWPICCERFVNTVLYSVKNIVLIKQRANFRKKFVMNAIEMIIHMTPKSQLLNVIANAIAVYSALLPACIASGTIEFAKSDTGERISTIGLGNQIIDCMVIIKKRIKIMNIQTRQVINDVRIEIVLNVRDGRIRHIFGGGKLTGIDFFKFIDRKGRPTNENWDDLDLEKDQCGDGLTDFLIQSSRKVYLVNNIDFWLIFINSMFTDIEDDIKRSLPFTEIIRQTNPRNLSEIDQISETEKMFKKLDYSTYQNARASHTIDFMINFTSDELNVISYLLLASNLSAEARSNSDSLISKSEYVPFSESSLGINQLANSNFLQNVIIKPSYTIRIQKYLVVTQPIKCSDFIEYLRLLCHRDDDSILSKIRKASDVEIVIDDTNCMKDVFFSNKSNEMCHKIDILKCLIKIQEYENLERQIIETAQNDETSPSGRCMICRIASSKILYMNCKHLVCCVSCFLNNYNTNFIRNITVNDIDINYINLRIIFKCLMCRTVNIKGVIVLDDCLKHSEMNNKCRKERSITMDQHLINDNNEIMLSSSQVIDNIKKSIFKTCDLCNSGKINVVDFNSGKLKYCIECYKINMTKLPKNRYAIVFT